MPKQAVDLIAASRAADSAYIEWRRLDRSGMRHLQENKRPLYERTASFKNSPGKRFVILIE